MTRLMGAAIGLIVGFYLYVGAVAVVGPFIAIWLFITGFWKQGRFGAAAFMLGVSMYCGTYVWDNLHVDRDAYIGLAVVGIFLELVRYFVVQMWYAFPRHFRQVRRERQEREFHININVVDDPNQRIEPQFMKDVTGQGRHW